MGNLLRKQSESSHILDESPNGGGGWTGKVSFGTERKKERENLLFSKIGMFFSNASNFFKNGSITDINVSCRSVKQGVGGKVVRLEFTFSEKEKKPDILTEISSIAYAGENETEQENTDNESTEKEVMPNVVPIAKPEPVKL